MRWERKVARMRETDSEWKWGHLRGFKQWWITRETCDGVGWVNLPLNMNFWRFCSVKKLGNMLVSLWDGRRRQDQWCWGGVIRLFILTSANERESRHLTTRSRENLKSQNKFCELGYKNVVIALMMEAVKASETSVTFARRDIPEDGSHVHTKCVIRDMLHRVIGLLRRILVWRHVENAENGWILSATLSVEPLWSIRGWFRQHGSRPIVLHARECLVRR